MMVAHRWASASSSKTSREPLRVWVPSRGPIVRVGSGSGGRGGGVVAVGDDAMVGFPCPFPCRAAQEVSAPDRSTPVGEVVIVA